MVIGYMCETHGFVRDCDVDDSGERICQECGMAVTGVVGRARDTYSSPPEGENMANGDITWSVFTGRGNHPTLHVEAFDLDDAGAQAAESVDNPQRVKEIKPLTPKYRA